MFICSPINEPYAKFYLARVAFQAYQISVDHNDPNYIRLVTLLEIIDSMTGCIKHDFHPEEAKEKQINCMQEFIDIIEEINMA